MTGPANRRGFLRGLVSLPLIGGGVTLIGSPTAVAEPVTRQLLERYSEWLRMERNSIHQELFPGCDQFALWCSASAARYRPEQEFYIPPAPASWEQAASASTRAALVLSTVGCNWRDGGR